MAFTDGFMQEFSASVEHVAQQKASKLMKCVRKETMDHEVCYFDTFDSSEVAARTKNGDIYANATRDYANIPQPGISRRQLTASAVFWDKTIDRNDIANLKADPTAQLVKSAGYALGRAYDRAILKALTAKVKTGRSGATEVTFKGSNIVSLGQNTHATAANAERLELVDGQNVHTTGLTLEKLLQARSLLRQHVDENEKLYFVCSPSQIDDLLRLEEITSINKNTVKALATGEIDAFLGFNFIVTSLLPVIRPASVSTTRKHSIRECYAFSESSIIFGKVKGQYLSKTTELTQNHFAPYIYLSDCVGAVRMLDNDVVTIKVYEKYIPEHVRGAADANAAIANAGGVVVAQNVIATAGNLINGANNVTAEVAAISIAGNADNPEHNVSGLLVVQCPATL